MEVLQAYKEKSKGIFYGWWVVISGTFLYGLGIGAVFYGFNTFFSPMVEEFGWSRAATSGAFSMSRLEGGFSGPIVGWLIDRFGARKIAIIGVITTGLGFMSLTLVRNLWTLYIIFGIFISVGNDMGFARPCTAAAAKWFIAKRSRAISFIVTGGGVGGGIIIPALGGLIAVYGWRSAAMITGIAILVLGLPPAFFMRSTPEEMGLQPDGIEPQFDDSGETGQIARPERELTVREALRTRSYWTYVTALLLRASILSSMVIHQIPHLEDMGLDYRMASGILGSMVAISIPGRLFFGWLGDKIDKRRILFFLCMMQAVGIFIFIHASTIFLLYIFVTVFGLGLGGAIPVVHAFRADLFGRRSFASLAGITMLFTMVPTVIAPILLGRLYDVTHSYVTGFYILLVLIILSGITFLMVRPPSVKGESVERS